MAIWKPTRGGRLRVLEVRSGGGFEISWVTEKEVCVTQLRKRMLEELQGRKSLRCLARLRIRWFDVILEAPDWLEDNKERLSVHAERLRHAVPWSSNEDQPTEKRGICRILGKKVVLFALGFFCF